MKPPDVLYEPETILQRVTCINSSSPVVDNYMNECNTVLCVLSLRFGSAMTYIGFHVTTSQTTPARSFTGTCCGLQVVIFIGRSERASANEKPPAATIILVLVPSDDEEGILLECNALALIIRSSVYNI